MGREFTNPDKTISCGASIYIASFGVSTVYLEVINPRTWVGSWREYSLSSGVYTKVSFPAWTANPRTVFLRISLGGSSRSYGILIDDLAIECRTSYP